METNSPCFCVTVALEETGAGLLISMYFWLLWAFCLKLLPYSHRLIVRASSYRKALWWLIRWETVRPLHTC